MEDIDYTDTVDGLVRDDEELRDDDESVGISFDDIVSFTMLLETSVTIIGIVVFFFFIVFGVF
ncbi:hypothetical protein ACFL6L_03205 [candidate division KSB1 bacterium]